MSDCCGRITFAPKSVMVAEFSRLEGLLKECLLRLPASICAHEQRGDVGLACDLAKLQAKIVTALED